MIELHAGLVALDAPAALEAARAAAGLPRDPAVCGPVWPDVGIVCVRIADGDGRRLLRASELGGRTAEAVLAEVRGTTRTRLAGAELQPITGTRSTYLQLADADAAAAAFWWPEDVAAKLGGAPVRIAVPVDGLVIAWKAAGPDLDKIGAVAVRQAWEQGAARSSAVSPQIVDWDGFRFTTFGQATPKPAP